MSAKCFNVPNGSYRVSTSFQAKELNVVRIAQANANNANGGIRLKYITKQVSVSSPNLETRNETKFLCSSSWQVSGGTVPSVNEGSSDPRIMTHKKNGSQPMYDPILLLSCARRICQIGDMGISVTIANNVALSMGNARSMIP